MHFLLPSIKCSAGPPSVRLLSRAVIKSIVVHSSDNETVLDSSRELGGPAEHLSDGSEKRICRSIFEFLRPHVIERRSNITSLIPEFYEEF